MSITTYFREQCLDSTEALKQEFPSFISTSLYCYVDELQVYKIDVGSNYGVQSLMRTEVNVGLLKKALGMPEKDVVKMLRDGRSSFHITESLSSQIFKYEREENTNAPYDIIDDEAIIDKEVGVRSLTKTIRLQRAKDAGSRRPCSKEDLILAMEKRIIVADIYYAPTITLIELSADIRKNLIKLAEMGEITSNGVPYAKFYRYMGIPKPSLEKLKSDYAYYSLFF